MMAKVLLLDKYFITLGKGQRIVFFHTKIFSTMALNKTTSHIGPIKMKHMLQNAG